jgi:hypothetical protein
MQVPLGMAVSSTIPRDFAPDPEGLFFNKPFTLARRMENGSIRPNCGESRVQVHEGL